MQYSIIIISLLVNISCCSTNMEQEASTEILLNGEYKSEHLQTGHIHGVVKMPVSDSLNIIETYISTDFYIKFNSDKTFILTTKSKKDKIGKYLMTKNSLILKQNNLPEIDLKIDSIINDRLFLKACFLKLYDLNNDTLTLLTVHNTTLELKNIHK